MQAMSLQLCPTLRDTCQAPRFMRFSRQEYFSGLLCPPPGDLHDPGVKSTSLTFPALAGGFLPLIPGGSDSKESACSVGDLGLIPGLGRSPGGGHGNSLQYSCLENPQGQRSLVGYSPWGHNESDMAEWLSPAQCMGSPITGLWTHIIECTCKQLLLLGVTWIRFLCRSFLPNYSHLRSFRGLMLLLGLDLTFSCRHVLPSCFPGCSLSLGC